MVQDSIPLHFPLMPNSMFPEQMLPEKPSSDGYYYYNYMKPDKSTLWGEESSYQMGPVILQQPNLVDEVTTRLLRPLLQKYYAHGPTRLLYLPQKERAFSSPSRYTPRIIEAGAGM